MSEGFEWNRIHKWEENIEMTVTESVFGFSPTTSLSITYKVGPAGIQSYSFLLM